MFISSKKLIRYPKPLSYALSFLSPHSISQTLNPSFSPFSQNPNSPHSLLYSTLFTFNSDFLHSVFFRSFYSSPIRTVEHSRIDSNVVPKQVLITIDLIRTADDDALGPILDTMNLGLSVNLIIEIFRVANRQKSSALSFFKWVVHKNPDLYRNYDVCSLIIDNCWCLDDYETMACLLNEFKNRHICLTEKAFGYLPVLVSSKTLVEESIRRLVEVLNEVGGSCKGSGICGLITGLCNFESFELARFVMQRTEKKVSYYHIMIRQMCKRFRVAEAKSLIKEMRESGCDPNTKTYNYLIGCLLKNNEFLEVQAIVREMREFGIPEDALTLEMAVFFSCKNGHLDVATGLVDKMESITEKPRHTAHVAFIKGCFQLNQFEKALEYAQNLNEKGYPSANVIYSLLVELHRKKGNIVTVQNILKEMMDKGLKPHYPAYKKARKMLDRTQRGKMAVMLKQNFVKSRVE